MQCRAASPSGRGRRSVRAKINNAGADQESNQQGFPFASIMPGGFGSEVGQNQAGNTRAGRTRREDGTGDAGRGGGEKQKGEGNIRHGKCT